MDFLDTREVPIDTLVRRAIEESKMRFIDSPLGVCRGRHASVLARYGNCVLYSCFDTRACPYLFFHEHGQYCVKSLEPSPHPWERQQTRGVYATVGASGESE